MVVNPFPLRLYSLVRQLRPPPTYRRAIATSTIRSQNLQPNFPSTPTCPPSQCTCVAMPEGLDIDHQKQLNGTMPPYAQHVVIRTGRSDWSSKIEDEKHTLGAEIRGGNLAMRLKGLVGRGGIYHDVGARSLFWYAV